MEKNKQKDHAETEAKNKQSASVGSADEVHPTNPSKTTKSEPTDSDALHLTDKKSEQSAVRNEKQREALSDLPPSRSARHQGKGKKRRAKSNRIKGKKPKKTWVKILQGILITLLIIVLGGLAYGATFLNKTNDTLDSFYKPTKSGKDVNNAISAMTKPFSMLLLGIDDNDERELGSNRTDTMIVVTMNPNTHNIKMVSIPRDTYTRINTKNYVGNTKINAAYTYDTEQGSIKAVEELLEIPINFYMTVDFQAFEKVVDALGGIDVDVPVAISEANATVTKMIELEPGKQTLNGEQALAFARTRKIDNDIKRGERQQMVIEAIIAKATELKSITKYQTIMESLKGHVWTNMNSNTMLQVAKSALSARYKIDSYTFSWMSFTNSYTGESMVGIHQDSLDYITHELKVSLDKETKDERDEPDFQFESDGEVSPKTYPFEEGGAIDD